MKRNWYWFGREWPYKNVKPRIICEEFISGTDTAPEDYKVLCFNGVAKLIEVHIGRFTNHIQVFYDLKWNKVDITQGYEGSDNTSSDLRKPKLLNEMIMLSEKLAKNMFQVRIDWYIVGEILYFGEITLYDGSGFVPFKDDDDDILLGSWIHLSIDK